ncbi:hypothetical protein D2V17_19475 [Aurantiacibacter xanthus]|uniref:Uncharacterized protein n=1 Tax=Aurantiacibacter xanthus TaxID=1784712 RepID=A0A3A1P4B1_9SPHN|nr:hypothetical protein D2V17_19475 [Aurantiacibacter xanthus]
MGEARSVQHRPAHGEILFRRIEAGERLYEAHSHIELVDNTGQLQKIVATQAARAHQQISVRFPYGVWFHLLSY